MKRLLIFTLLFTALIGLNTQCTSDSKTNEENPATTVPTIGAADFMGNWDLVGAERNGKVTNSLDGIFFTFKAGNQMTSNFNLSVEERTFAFDIKDKTLIEKSTPERRYLIESINPEELVLITKLENILFRLKLQPALEVEESTMDQEI